MTKVCQLLINKFKEVPTQPPTPSSSVLASQSFSPVSTASGKPLRSPSARHDRWVSCASGFPVTSYLGVGGSSVSASSLRVRDHLGPSIHWLRFVSLLPRLHRGPSSHQLHRATLVSCPPVYTSGLYSSSSFCPSGSIGLLSPSGSSFVLCRSGSAASFRIPFSASVT